jgi:hypothetical protein
LEQDFVTKLKNHLLGRLLHREYDGDEHQFSDADRNTIRICDNRIYSAKVVRINYTTYDVRRGQDTLNPRTHANIMMLSPDTSPGAHPYWYARILGVFHAQILHTGPAATNRSLQRVEFLWVRWYGEVPGHRWGFKRARLFKVGFVPDTDESAFGFLDPSLVLRGCHLIPAFNDGKTTDLLRASSTVARPPGVMEDWRTFYVMMLAAGSLVCIHLSDYFYRFVDRDMFMRYLGGAVGHTNARPGPHSSTPDDDSTGEQETDEGDDIGMDDGGYSDGLGSKGDNADDADGGEDDDSDDGEGNDDDDDDDGDGDGDEDEDEDEDLGPDDGEDDEDLDMDDNYDDL